MSRSLPYAGLSRDRLTALINSSRASSQPPLVEGVDFHYSDMQPYEGSSGRNTKIKLNPLPGSTYDTSQWIYYTRLPLTVLSKAPPGEVLIAEIPELPFTIHEALPYINAALGLNLQATEVMDERFEQERVSYSLRIVESQSVAWIDSIFSFKAVIVDTRVELSDVIVDPVMTGLTYTQPDDQGNYTDSLMFGSGSGLDLSSFMNLTL